MGSTNMNPDFKKSTIDILAKRAGFKCSNPDCRVSTIGPNKDKNKSTLIGEAAHIYGAREGSKRYVINMNNLARAEITNAIWLCRNCHKKIDSDDKRYSANLLFSWRNMHEEYIGNELGNISDKIVYKESNAKIEAFHNYPQIIKRIIIDEPVGWEWRLASELLSHLNKSKFRKLQNLNDKLYTRPLTRIEKNNFLDWVRFKNAEIGNLIPPFEGLLQHLTLSFGELGTKGDIDEIHHICMLISDYIEQIIIFEESLHFVHVPKEYIRIIDLFKNCMGSQALKLKEIPTWLNDAVEEAITRKSQNIIEPKTIKKVIQLDMPLNWSLRIQNELDKIKN